MHVGWLLDAVAPHVTGPAATPEHKVVQVERGDVHSMRKVGGGHHAGGSGIVQHNVRVVPRWMEAAASGLLAGSADAIGRQGGHWRCAHPKQARAIALLKGHETAGKVCEVGCILLDADSFSVEGDLVQPKVECDQVPPAAARLSSPRIQAVHAEVGRRCIAGAVRQLLG